MRGNVRVVDGGLLKLDSAQCSAREFPILLPKDVVYACHAAAMVHFAKGWIHHEVGKVDLAHMQTVLDAAYGMGMTLPPRPSPPWVINVIIIIAASSPPRCGKGKRAKPTTRASCFPWSRLHLVCRGWWRREWARSR